MGNAATSASDGPGDTGSSMDRTCTDLRAAVNAKARNVGKGGGAERAAQPAAAIGRGGTRAAVGPSSEPCAEGASIKAKPSRRHRHVLAVLVCLVITGGLAAGIAAAVASSAEGDTAPVNDNSAIVPSPPPSSPSPPTSPSPPPDPPSSPPLPPQPPPPPLPPHVPGQILVTEGTHLSALEPSSIFSARIRSVDDALWQDSFVFVTKSDKKYDDKTGNVKSGYFFSLENWTASWVSYEVTPDQAVEIEISKLDGASVISAVVHPADRGTVSLVGGKALITVVGPKQLTVDIDGAMDERNTAGWASGDRLHPRVGVAHTFSIFANPFLEYDRPDPNDADVLTVAPGTEPPVSFTQTTLYFLPGVHRPRTIPACCSVPAWVDTGGCICDSSDTSSPGYVAPYLLQANKNYYVPSDAWIDGWFDTDMSGSNGKWLRSTRFFGYGVISGRMFKRRLSDGNTSPKGINMRNMAGSELMGLTLVDTINHALILKGKGQGGGLLASGPVNWNSLSHVKVLNWRGNGDGVHVFNYWNEIHDLFLRTQDGSMYFASGMRSYTTWRRVTTWNDANGIPFMIAANGVTFGHGTGRLEDSDILYHRKQWPEWCGGIFDLRNVNTSMRHLTMRNIRIHDPFPTCPLLDVAGGFSDVSFENVHMASHSAFRDINHMFGRCDNIAKRRFFMQVAHIPGCMLPRTGIPNRLVAATVFTDDGYVLDPTVRMTRLSFTNVTVNGTNLGTLFSHPDYEGAVVTGGAIDLTFDGVPYTP